MAITFSNIGTAVGTVSNTALTANSINLNVGSWALVCIAADNAGTNGVASLLDTLVDSAGNTYQLLSKTTQDPGASSAGTTLGIWLSKIDNVLIEGTITASFSPNTTAKAMTVQAISVDAGETLITSVVGPGYTGASSASSVSVSVPSGYTVFFATAQEQLVAVTPDTDTINGSWSTAYTAVSNVSSAASLSQYLLTQWKTVSATGTQTYNTSGVSFRDYAVNYVIFYPQEIPKLRGFWAVNGVTTK